MDLKRGLISINDLDSQTIKKIFDFATEFKQYNNSHSSNHLENKNLALIFSKPSTRTRVSFQVGIKQLGGSSFFLGMNDIQMGRGETIHDTVKVISKYCSGIVARLFEHEKIIEMKEHSDIPIINGLTDLLHPCQGLTDLFTVQEKLGKRLEGLKLAYIGDSNNVCHSLMHACSKLGVDMSIGCPDNYSPKQEIVKNFNNNAEESGSKLVITKDPEEAVKEADIVYTDTWISMGQENEKKERIKVFKSFQVNRKLMSFAKKEAIFMHCLPAHRGFEVTDQVIDGEQSVVWDQAENRLHVQKALLSMIF